MVGNILEMVGNHETDGWKFDPFILLGVGLRWLAIISMVGFFQFCCFEIF